MAGFEKYKWPVIIIISIVSVLMIMIAVGFTIGILSEDPDGLERVLIDANGGGEEGEEWIEELPPAWNPVLAWLENDYIAGILGVILSVIIMVALFYGISFLKKRNKK